MKNKVQGESNLCYWNLTYKRKFIRTLWMTPLVILAIGVLVLSENNPLISVLLVVIYLWQLIYTYIKSKKA